MSIQKLSSNNLACLGIPAARDQTGHASLRWKPPDEGKGGKMAVSP